MRRFIMLLAALSLITIWATPAEAEDVKAPADVKVEAPVGDVVAPAIGDVKSDVTEAEGEKLKPEDIKEIAEQVSILVQLFKEGKWGMAIGLLLSLLLMIFRKFFKKMVPEKALPWVAVGVGIIGCIATNLISGVVWWTAILQGITAGAAATGMWQLIFKRMDKKAA